MMTMTQKIRGIIEQMFEQGGGGKTDYYIPLWGHRHVCKKHS